MSELLPNPPRAVIEVDGIAVAARYGSSLRAEVRAVRRSVGLSVLEHVSCLRLSGGGAEAALERICPVDLYLRDSQVRQTLLLSEDGTPLADAYLGCDDDGWLLVAEGLAGGELRAYLREQAGSSVDLEDWGEERVLISLNGPFAWELLSRIEGPEVIGFPYLSLYHPRPGHTYLRAGKTGEFGYDLLVPRAAAAELLERLLEAGQESLDLLSVGIEALWHCALENWFFNIHREGRQQLTPAELGLQWRISYSRDGYIGAAAVRARKERLDRRLTALRSDAAVAAGAEVRLGEQVIGTVLHSERSATLGATIAIGLLQLPYAHAGLAGFTAPGPAGEPTPIRTVSAPFVNNLSIYINPQQHCYRNRDEIAFPGADRERLL